MTTLFMALAGGLGAGARYSLDAWMRPRVPASLPWSTQLINTTGSLLLGTIVGLGASDSWHTIAGVGFLGGYTTFSTASVESVHLAIDRRYGAAFANAVGMLIVCVAAAALGYAMGRAL
jgi:CrcB protein